MLIEFKVANFRSFREEQTFSLVASNYEKSLPENVIDVKLPGLSKMKYLRGAAVYGANASGKSNLLEAIRFVSRFVRDSVGSGTPDMPIGVSPFRLDSSTVSDPSRFEMSFVVDDCRYMFRLVLDRVRVVEESLTAFPNGVPLCYYERVYSPAEGYYKWSTPSRAFKSDDSLKEKTRPNSSFLSVGVQFNHPQLSPIYFWFRNQLRFLGFARDSFHDNLSASLALLESDAESRELFTRMLRSADLGVADVILREHSADATVTDLESQKMVLREMASAAYSRRSRRAPAFLPDGRELVSVHSPGETGITMFDFLEDESAGTVRFFSLLGVWIDALRNGGALIIDEIESSLHPQLVRELIKLVFSAGSGSKDAQLIFTTHNPLLLDKTLLRRDQVWFTEKDQAGATRLYPLTDYMPRKDESLPRGYLAGRYGAVPFLPEGLKL